MLCKRLLFSASFMIDLEESVINQLKSVCGYEFTSKFHRMFNDIQLSPEMNTNFQKYLDEKDIQIKHGSQFTVLTVSMAGDLIAAFRSESLNYNNSYETLKIQIYC
ncbi:unnamed protein product [Protopolystoma xenopodis]|uniref:Cullin family profile domain-containing protein n=1 Tax=Protopolystoma xenopodis TaxID=117903 RepID=A0A3S5CTE9_9PLAT|nr:unnamed protein product [Protopolystoma xenopodis]